MNKIKFFVAFVFVSGLMFSQETAPNYLLYKYNMNILNPAYAGVTGKKQLNIGFRTQQLDVQQNPKGQQLSYSDSFGRNVGLGVSITNNEFFINKTTDFAADFSYKLTFDPYTSLYFGLKAGGTIYAIDYLSLGVNDPLFSENISTFAPLVGVGAYLKGERYYLSISIPNVLLSEVQKPVSDNMGGFTNSVTEKMHLYLGGGYEFNISENLDLEPFVFSRIVPDEKLLLDVGLTADIQEKIEIGATYRMDTSIVGSFMLKLLEKTHFGYAYEVTTGDLATIASGTHEFVVRFQFP